MHSSSRPLSPHLQVYRWQLTMVLSILHRATGIILAASTLLITAFLLMAAMGPDMFEMALAWATSPFGWLILFGWSLCLYYHLANGIRHLFWDMGLGFSIPATYKSGYAVVAFALIAQILTWAYIW
ncbi:MAG: succinate dehydrogenase, cytochrome b556 subunit [Dongiaceae bacterium]